MACLPAWLLSPCRTRNPHSCSPEDTDSAPPQEGWGGCPLAHLVLVSLLPLCTLTLGQPHWPQLSNPSSPSPAHPPLSFLFIQFQLFLLGPGRAPSQGEGKPGSAAPPASNQPVTPHKSCHCLDLGLLGQGSVQSCVSKQEPEAALSHLNLLPPSPGSPLGTRRGAPASGKDQRSWLGSLAGLWKGQVERGVQVARDPTCRPPLTWRSPPPRKARPGKACPPTLPASPMSPVPRRENELQGFLLPSLAGRLRTAEQEAIWGGMEAVRRRQPPEDLFPPPPPSQLRQPA